MQFINLKNQYLKYALIFTLGVIISLSIKTILADWEAPPNPPPGCPASEPACNTPINVGSGEQVKSGKLGAATDGIDPAYGLTVGNATNLLGIKTSGISFFGGKRVMGVATPMDGTDAVNRDYVDALVGGGGGYWTKLGSSLYPNDTGWKVGIGTTTPNNTIQVAGLINFDNAKFSISLGQQAGNVNTGLGNTFIGLEAGRYNTSGFLNTFLGTAVGHANTTGSDNTFLGYVAGGTNTTGSKNTFVGHGAGVLNTTGNENTYLGFSTGYSNNGSKNTFVGAGAGTVSTVGDGNIFLGWQAGYSETGSNKLYIDNSDTATPLIYGDFSANALTINGNLKVTSGGSANKVVCWKSDNTLGYCSTAPDATGACTCN